MRNFVTKFKKRKRKASIKKHKFEKETDSTMASISEILNRDPRTTRSIIKNDKNADCISSLSDINDFQSFCNCDKCQNKYQPTTGSNFKNKLTNFKMKSK